MSTETVQRRSEGKLLGESALLYLASYVATAFRLLGRLVLLGLLTAELMGLRRMFELFTRYEVYSHLGTFDGMRKEISFHRGRGDEERVAQVMSTVFSANAVYAAAIGTILVLLAIAFSRTTLDPIYADFCLFMAAHIALDKLRTFLNLQVIAEKLTAVVAKSRVLHEFLVALLSAVFVYFWGLRGLFIGILIAETVAVAYLFLAVGSLPRFGISKSLLLSLVRMGIPVMLSGLAFLLLRSVDEIIVAAMTSTEVFGYFAAAVLMSALIYMALTDVMGTIFFPRMMERAGAADAVAELKPYLVQPTLLVAYLVPFLVGAAVIAIPWPLEYFLRDYLPALDTARILTLGSLFYCASIMPLMICIGVNRQVSMLMMALGVVLLNAAFSYTLIRLGFGIEGVAVGTVVSHFVFCTAIIGFLLRIFGDSLSESLRFLATIYAPFAYAAVLLWLLDGFSAISVTGVWTGLFSSLINIILFCMAFSLVLIPIRRQPAFASLAAGLHGLRKRN